MLKENDSLVQVKICGLTSMDDVHIIEKYGADYAGMVLYYPKSRRNIDINLAAVLVAQLKKSDIKSVAVVVSPDVSQLEAIQNAGFDYIQIHGEVPDEVLQAADLKIWKAFNVTDLSEFDRYNKRKEICGFVLDAAAPGSGQVFEWDLLKKLPETDKMKLLAGGLDPENVEQALMLKGIDGVDTSSGVEKEDGKGKDRKKIELFIEKVREW